MQCHGGGQRGDSTMEVCGDENNVGHPYQHPKLWSGTTCWSTLLGRCLKKDDFMTVGEIRYSCGANVQFELIGTWVDDNVLHTEEDGRMEIETDTIRPSESKTTYSTYPLQTAQEVSLAATATEVVLSHEEQKSMCVMPFASLVWHMNL